MNTETTPKEPGELTFGLLVELLYGGFCEGDIGLRQEHLKLAEVIAPLLDRHRSVKARELVRRMRARLKNPLDLDKDGDLSEQLVRYALNLDAEGEPKPAAVPGS